MSQTIPTASQPDPNDFVDKREELRIELIGREYDNFAQSSFNSDGLRNQIIQFYLILVGAASTAIVGIAQLEGTPAGSKVQALWPFGVVALAIGLTGMVILPIFVRLRRVVIECLTGTVLLKGYAEKVTRKSEAEKFRSAFLWDANSLPLNESYASASFFLVFVMMLLSSSMLALSLFLFLLEGLGSNAQFPEIVWWSLTIGLAALGIQVLLYRWLLHRELLKFIAQDNLVTKWRALDIGGDPKMPELRRPFWGALAFFGIPTLVCLWQASTRLPPAQVLEILTRGFR